MTDTLSHQRGQEFPRLDFPLVEGDPPRITRPWQRLLMDMWLRLGASSAPAGAQNITLTSNPFDYTAPLGGQVVTSSGTFQFSRDGGSTFFRVGMNGLGGSIVVTPQDVVRISWTGPVPLATFFPGL